MDRTGWWYALRRSFVESVDDHLIDRAAALTFFAVLSVFPGLVALVSILGLVGQGAATTNAVLDLLEDPLPSEIVAQLREPIASITENRSAGLGLVVGVLAAMWTASNYVYAFSRAMNRVYGMQEGRPLWKHRPAMYLLTIGLVLLVSVAALLLVVSGPVARWLGDLVGLGSTALTVWNVVRWPVLLLVVMVMLALLYYTTPNARLSRMRWISPGAVLAIVVGGAGTVGFGFYVSSFGRFNATYGALGGVVVFLLWLFLMNLVIVFGAELDSELSRVRQLRAGLPAERDLQLPLRDGRKIAKVDARRTRLLAEARALRPDPAGAGPGDVGPAGAGPGDVGPAGAGAGPLRPDPSRPRVVGRGHRPRRWSRDTSSGVDDTVR
ncbi:MAG: YihY/virulence factor BrkB family protein [Actinomycetaceae bacterium]